MPFIYATNYETLMIEPDLVARDRAGRLGLDLMPPVNRNRAKVRWTQRDNYAGLQKLRGMDGAPTRVGRVGKKTFEYEPGVFGEFIDITETELTNRAGDGIDVTNVPIDIDDLVAEADDLLIYREDERMESSIWSLLVTGTLTIIIDGPNGTQVGYSDTYPIQTYTALVPWGTLATATPIRDFQSVQQLGAAAGHSVDFGAAATAYMNSVTANLLLNNQNANDLSGRRINGGGTINTLVDVGSFLLGQNLPKIRVYDAGNLPEGKSSGPVVKYIPDRKVVLIGQRPGGAKVGEYQLTRNASNNFNPGSYRKVFDRANGRMNANSNAEQKVPANIEIHRGHNGGPAIYYPSAIVVMNV